MLFISLAVITFGLAQTLPIVDEAIETPSTSEGPGGPDGGRVVFDQRQTGKYNIHVSIKDVAIIEVGQNGLAEESYNDEEDYYYDDSALTVKPIKLSTEASTSSTSSFSTTTTSSTTAGAPPAEITSPTTISSKPKSRLNNLMIVETPIGGATVKPLHHPASLLHARSKDVPIMAAAAAANTPPSLPESIEYTPPQGHNSPIFKVKVQRSSNPATKKPARCRNHQVRDAQGKCTDSIYRKLFGMLKGLNFPFLAANAAESA